MNKKVFFMEEEIRKSFDFAKNMKGKHALHFKGKEVIEKRNDKEIFENDFQGKLSEIAVRNYVKQKYGDKVKIKNDIDFDIYERGVWDNCDLQLNNSNVSIKSIKDRSVVLMIEASRFKEDGSYSYRNNDNSDATPDKYILVSVKIEPTITWDDFKNDFDYFLNPYENIRTKDKKVKRKIEANILGMIDHKDFWEKKKYIPRGTMINVRNMNDYLLYGKKLDELSKDRGVPLIANNYAVHKDILKSF